MSKHKFLIILCVAFLAIGLSGSIFLLNRPHGTWIEIVQNNEVLYRLDLVDADCPDHTCINMDWLDSSMPIVCLPNHLVIQFEDANEEIDTIVN